MRHLIFSIAILALGVPLQAQEDRTARELELYDILDLIAGRRDFPGIDVSLARDSKGSGVVVESVDRSADLYVPAVRALISPASSATLKDGVLAVRATEEEHRSIRDLLGVYRRRLGLLVTVEARFINSPVALREEAAAASFVRLPDAEADGLIKKAATGGAEVLMSPKLTLHNGQLAFIFVGEQMAHVREFELTPGADGKLRAEPVVEVSKTGTWLEIRAVVKNAEKEEILLENLKLLLAEPKQKGKVRTIETPYGKIEDPEVQTIKLSISSGLKAGESLLIGPLSRPWSAKDDPKLWVQLRARVIPAADVTPPKEK